MSDFSVYNSIQKALPQATGLAKPGGAGEKSGGAFGSMLQQAIDQVSDLEKTSQGELGKFMNNESDLHSVMIALEKADLSFQTMMQVRNKIVSAYQEIMRTQV